MPVRAAPQGFPCQLVSARATSWWRLRYQRVGSRPSRRWCGVAERAPAGAGTDSVGGARVAGCPEPVTPIVAAAEIDRDAASLALEQHFAVVPEWIIDADISDCAYRLYSVLLRYGQTSGQRMPARATLAGRLRKSSKDTVDRALKELVAIGAVIVERRRRDGRNLTNRYLLMATPPQSRAAATPAGGGGGGGGRKPAARPRVFYPEPPTTTAPIQVPGDRRRPSRHQRSATPRDPSRRRRHGPACPLRHRRPSSAGRRLPDAAPPARSPDRPLDRGSAAAGHSPRRRRWAGGRRS